MICLDTNYLILGVTPGTRESSQLIAWAQAGEIMVAPAIVWYEFLCGPVTSAQIEVMRAFLREIVPFGEVEAKEGARLFNAVKRNRHLRVDAMIAGTAISLQCSLATNNHADFELFEADGLKLENR